MSDAQTSGVTKQGARWSRARGATSSLRVPTLKIRQECYYTLIIFSDFNEIICNTITFSKSNFFVL